MSESAHSEVACLSVVMPIYNEAATIDKIVSTVLAQPMVAEMIAVDDGSTDRSWKILTDIQARDPRRRSSHWVCHRQLTDCFDSRCRPGVRSGRVRKIAAPDSQRKS
jgi:glycosyltransferase involved in cell wall biosynthesis